LIRESTELESNLFASRPCWLKQLFDGDIFFALFGSVYLRRA
jgi:hypothetical protein